MDHRLLEEVEFLVQELSAFSRQHGAAFEFELDTKFVGVIENGQIDKCLAVGLLGEWRRILDAGRRPICRQAKTASTKEGNASNLVSCSNFIMFDKHIVFEIGFPAATTRYNYM